jgi:hypothetical protein
MVAVRIARGLDASGSGGRRTDDSRAGTTGPRCDVLDMPYGLEIGAARIFCCPHTNSIPQWSDRD